MEIVACSREKQPFPVEMIVFEEDTWMVMSASNRVRDLPPSTEESLHEISGFSPRRTGELVVRGNRAFAIVHDFDNDPSFSPSAAREALREIARLSAEQGIESVAVQAMGTSRQETGLKWLQAEIKGLLAAGNIKRVWLIVP